MTNEEIGQELGTLAIEVLELRRQVQHLHDALSAAGAFIDAALRPAEAG